MKQLALIAISILSFNYACRRDKPADPYFGNGVHNGWADQNSIVIWTRLTANPEMNRLGPQFLVPSADRHRKLDEEANPDSIYKAQIPEGYTLDQMEGACPGTDGEVRLACYPLRNRELRIERDWTPVSEKKNYTVQWKLDGLMPDTKYIVELEARADSKSEVSASILGSFRTPPEKDSIQSAEFCIVTCHDYPRRDDKLNGHKIYRSMISPFPDFFIHTGDIEYYDKPGPYALTEDLMRFKWDRIFALPYQRDFYSNVTSYFMKDDHDALTNDAFPGMKYGTVTWERGLEIFDKEQFPSNDVPYKTVRWGRDLQVWFMEGRNYRSRNTDPDGPGKTIWGKEQKDWLFRTLEESDATFKVIVTPGPILGPDRANKGDNYSNRQFSHEGDEIREYLKQYDNVFICNGDRHWQYVTNIPGTSLWEFSCGAGSDKHAEGWPQEDIRPEHRFLRVKGGFLRARVWREAGEIFIRFQHCDVDGNIVHEEKFNRSDKF